MVTFETRPCPGSGEAWASKSKALLSRWQVPDWPVFADGGSTLAKYKRFLRAHLAEVCKGKWEQDLARYTRPRLYSSFRPTANADYKLALSTKTALGWSQLCMQQSLSRLRLGTITLAHLSGRRSQARYQHCIFCNCKTLSPFLHSFTACSR